VVVSSPRGFFRPSFQLATNAGPRRGGLDSPEAAGDEMLGRVRVFFRRPWPPHSFPQRFPVPSRSPGIPGAMTVTRSTVSVHVRALIAGGRHALP
jgi:hypothetical protein